MNAPSPFPEAVPLILTLRFDPVTFARLDELRRKHFPSGRNIVPAHVTLFHQLPGDQVPAIADRLREVAGRTPSIDLSVVGPRFLGRGVALEVTAPPLLQLRAGLATAWEDWLGRQDTQGYRPHVTIQNKVDPPVARRLFDALRTDWEPLLGRGEGLLLWRYRGGPWEPVEEFDFLG